TVLRVDAVKPNDVARAVDLHDPAGKKLPTFDSTTPELETTPAWRGTLPPATDADLWLTTAFANYERHAALENALRREGGDLKQADLDRLAVSLLGFRSLYELGARSEGDVPLARLKTDLTKDGWHRIAQGKGALALHALRSEIGGEAFDSLMDEFG